MNKKILYEKYLLFKNFIILKKRIDKPEFTLYNSSKISSHIENLTDFAVYDNKKIIKIFIFS